MTTEDNTTERSQPPASEKGTHTETPWSLRPKRHGDSWWVVAPKSDGTEGYVAECVGRQEANESNARFIVTAVNCHAELLATVRIAEEYITHELNAPLGTRIEQRKITLPMLRAAIANAERQAQS